MTCPHAETTAILALFDEAPPEFDDHLAACQDCQDTLAQHSETLDLITPHLPSPAVPAPAPRPAPTRWILAAAVAAAAAALVVGMMPPDLSPAPASLAPVMGDLALEEDPDGLLALELELALIHLEDTD